MLSQCSYVCQSASLIGYFDRAAREHTAIHRILRMPPESMPRALMPAIGFCTVLEPTRAVDYGLAVMCMLAVSKRFYFLHLAANIHKLCGDDVPMREGVRQAPRGHLDIPSISQSLLDASTSKGAHSRLLTATQRDPNYVLFDNRNREALLTKQDKVQIAVIRLLCLQVSYHNLSGFLAQSLVVTLGGAFAIQTHLSPIWWDDLRLLLSNGPAGLKPCIVLGCLDEDGNIMRYLVCPILWQIACGLFKGEESPSVSERLCPQIPCIATLQRLSVCHGVHHACKNAPV